MNYDESFGCFCETNNETTGTYTNTHTRKQSARECRTSLMNEKRCANIFRIGFPDYKSTVQIFNVEKCQ